MEEEIREGGEASSSSETLAGDQILDGGRRGTIGIGEMMEIGEEIKAIRDGADNRKATKGGEDAKIIIMAIRIKGMDSTIRAMQTNNKMGRCLDLDARQITEDMETMTVRMEETTEIAHQGPMEAKIFHLSLCK